MFCKGVVNSRMVCKRVVNSLCLSARVRVLCVLGWAGLGCGVCVRVGGGGGGLGGGVGGGGTVFVCVCVCARASNLSSSRSVQLSYPPPPSPPPPHTPPPHPRRPCVCVCVSRKSGVGDSRGVCMGGGGGVEGGGRRREERIFICKVLQSLSNSTTCFDQRQTLHRPVGLTIHTCKQHAHIYRDLVTPASAYARHASPISRGNLRRDPRKGHTMPNTSWQCRSIRSTDNSSSYFVWPKNCSAAKQSQTRSREVNVTWLLIAREFLP